MSYDSATVLRDGEPKLTLSRPPGSLELPNKYQIRTTPLPGGAQGVDRVGFFNSQLGRPPIFGYHDGTKIIVECHPDDEPNLTEKVDSAIEYANEQLRGLRG